MEPIDTDAAFDAIDEQWSPRTAATVDDHALKLARVEGAFVWHSHPDADELFLVREGELTVQFRDAEDADLGPGDALRVPAGVEHRPVADGEAKLMLFEPADTENTGDAHDAEFATTTGESLE
jgi:mannose-6-phosphate isomerase-like protein (cupin superfamily)